MSKGNVEVFAAAIATGRTIGEAAAAASISVRTAQRRLNDPGVVAAIEQKRAALGAAEHDEWRRLRSQSMARLGELIADDDPRVAVRAIALVFRGSAHHEMAHEFRQELGEVSSVLMSLQIALNEGPSGRA